MTDKLRKALRALKSPALRALYRWSAPVRKSVLLISVISVAASLLSLGLTLVTRSLIDGATGKDLSALWLYGALLVVIMAAERLLSALSARLRLRSSVRLQMEMQRMVTTSLMGKEYAAIKPYHSGELVNRVFSDVGVVCGGMLNLLPMLLRTAVSFIGAAVILVTMDWRFLPVLVAGSLAGTALTLAFREPMKRRHRRVQEAQGALHASTQESLENIRVVKASMSEERTLRQIDARREGLAEEQIRNGRLSNWMNQGMGSLFDLGWLLCNLWGCVRIYQGTFTYGGLAAMIQLIGRVQGPIASAVSMASQAYGVVSSAERLMEVVDLPAEREGSHLTDFDEIRLEHVSFHYEDGDGEVLNDISATIHRGDFVALTGRSGGGKTSLFQLLLAIYRPTAGQVLFVSGPEISPASRGTRALFAYVPQGNTLFSGTLRANLTMFSDQVTEEELQRVIQIVCLERLVDEIGLDAVLGERGMGLSEGQAQRVAVGRALLSGAPILLLDEATSALDEATEAQLLKNITSLKGKTVIIVTHRRAALAVCHKQLYIENGRLTPVSGKVSPEI